MDYASCSTNMETSNWKLKRQKKDKKEDTIKKKKIRGESHVNHRGKYVQERCTGPACSCRNDCFSKTSEELRHSILTQFNSFSNKNGQDSHLAGLISSKPPVRRRSRKIELSDSEEDPEHTYAHSAYYTYKVRDGSEEITVCQVAFLHLHGITRGRLRRIQDALVKDGCAPVDKRGKHSVNRYKKTPVEIVNLIEDHIKSFKARQSHYSRRKNPEKLYLPETLTVKEMHKMFLHCYRINVYYHLYWDVFTNKFNIKFGLPRSDTCAFCDTMQNKITACSDENEKHTLTIEHDVHKAKAETFYELKRAFKNKAKQGLVTCISFDYMQNLPLPHIKTSDVFYSRQLWYYVFGIHDLGKNLVHMNVYDEMTGKKGQNDVTSMLLKYLASIEIVSENNTLILFSDGCSGQNKNYVMVRFLFYLVHCLKVFKKIIYIFPIRGHSYLPNDQDFSLVEAQKRKHTVEVQKDWDELIGSARSNPSPFNVVNINQDDLLNIKDGLEPYFLKQCRPPMKLKGIRMLKIRHSDTHSVLVRDNFNGTWSTIRIRNNKTMPELITFEPSNKFPIPLNPAKLADIKKLAAFLKNPLSTQYYLNLTLAGTSSSQHDTDMDDNSSGNEDV